MTLTRMSAVASALLLVVMLAPAARAQGLPGSGDLAGTAGGATGGVTDAVGGSTGGVTDAVGGATGGATDAASGTTGGVTDAVGGATGGGNTTATGGTPDVGGTVGDTVGGVTDAVGGATGGGTPNAGGTVDDTVGGVTDAVGGATGGGGKDPVTETVGGLTGNQSGSGSSSGGSSPVTGLLGGGSGSNLSDLTPALVDDLVEEAAAHGLSPAAAEGWIEGKTVLDPAAYSSPRAALASLSALVEDAAQGMIDVGTSTTTTADVSGATEPGSGSFFASAGRMAAEAAKDLAFPLALALVVAGFLVAQGRVGRKDPKLVLAPVDTREESLTFE